MSSNTCFMEKHPWLPAVKAEWHVSFRNMYYISCFSQIHGLCNACFWRTHDTCILQKHQRNRLYISKIISRGTFYIILKEKFIRKHKTCSVIHISWRNIDGCLQCIKGHGEALWQWWTSKKNGSIINALMLWWLLASQQEWKIFFCEEGIQRRCSPFQGMILGQFDNNNNMCLKVFEHLDDWSYFHVIR